MPKFLAKLTSEKPGSLSSRMRAKRMSLLVARIEAIHRQHGEVSILDVGGRKRFWLPILEVLEKCHARVSVFNLPGEIDIHGGENGDDAIFTHVKGDACNMERYADKDFHLAVSNSVIEHVGDWSRIKMFAAECRRVAQSLFIQTPNYWFPVEPHYVCPFFHWLPKPCQAWLFMHFKFAVRSKTQDFDHAMRWADETPYLLTRKMMTYLFPDCRIVAEKAAVVLNKSWIAIRE